MFSSDIMCFEINSRKNVRKIDVHHHLAEEENYVENLLKEMDRHEIEKSSLIGLGPLFKGLFVKGKHDGTCADNTAVEKVFRKYPDRFFGLGFVRLGVDSPPLVDELHEKGFAGLKFTIPKKRYDDEGYFPVYQKAQELKMPCLFHTGIVKLPCACPGERVSSFNMDCIHLEAIAQEFPELKIIIAHLGVQNYLTALTLVRLFPNIYADLSGSTPGWRANLTMEEWRKYLWFPNASEKLLFGTDVHFCEFSRNIDIYEKIIAAANWNKIQRENIFYKNSSKIFSI
ncbi:MAG: hypothetical protein A2017_21990 [Lentisphaerae bacterium GWF2_44_16]|nr:MAG: hypothetical protein A2017_21990 [Lentisphaerae bacterium GWF2_44_16]